MKVVLAHHWIMSYRGGERAFEQVACLFPDAPIYLLAHDPGIQCPGLAGRNFYLSSLNRVPGVKRLYKHLLPLHPAAIKRIKIPADTDLLISSDASMIKGIPTPPSTKHLCYCHSPPRYIWELAEDYKSTSLGARLFLDRFIAQLQRFDHAAAQNVDHFAANSKFVADRIKRYYGRDSEVIYPAVAVQEFKSDHRREDFYLVLSELTPYKRIDIAVRAFAKTNRKLVVIGSGSERARLEKIATPNIHFLGRQDFTTVKHHFETAKGFIFPGIEDFGIAPVEAQAAGCPVIALRAGGALETVVDGVTGLFFDQQDPECLQDAVDRFESQSFPADVCRSHAETFATDRFHREFKDFVDRCLS